MTYVHRRDDRTDLAGQNFRPNISTSAIAITQRLVALSVAQISCE